MNWEVINNERSSLKEYRLIDNDDCKLVIKYNPLHRSARITSGNHHRLFFFESTGSLTGKTIFRNEYGMEIGKLAHDRSHSRDGALVIDNKKYQYHLQGSASPKLDIYENDRRVPVASCGIPPTRTPDSGIFSTITQEIDINCYLLGLCWYLFLPPVIENTQTYAPMNFNHTAARIS